MIGKVPHAQSNNFSEVPCVAMSDSPHFRARMPARLPVGMLGLDYLKFLQLSVDDELCRKGSFVDAALQDAMAAIRKGSMRTEQPAMKVFFDGCQFWLASHFHRHEAARRLDAFHQEFWCDIQPGQKAHAVRHASERPT
ncbi:hypothetical protein FHX57_007189 [Paraburkholderia tropica]|nr:hypothetical protein [Paraburkholderia tropica]MBB2983968.1 hypothetical protein [Paraburkholderia tropica]MBB3004803.1 hypothetical protein [Paraburkholderia tropica]MBB6323791.1 hypothetical protein [Paraburkholderia tropica]RQN36304.1 hypothetical protein EHZ25_25175 [Paraburkholderia tropica]